MGAETKITFLGCGTSTGVPVISCKCDVCISGDPKNIRTRSSIFLESENTKLLIDTGPDLREQLLREEITEADAILYTHGHADHVAGFDDTRAFCWRREDRLPIHGSEQTIEILARMFPWAFDESYNGRGYIRAKAMPFTSRFHIGDFAITPFLVEHASVETHGFRIDLPSGKSFVYAPDIKRLPDAGMEISRGCDIHIVDGLRHEDHPSHMTVAEALALTQKLDSPRAYLTHISCFVDYHKDSAELPQNRYFAYDGLNFML